MSGMRRGLRGVAAAVVVVALAGVADAAHATPLAASASSRPTSNDEPTPDPLAGAPYLFDNGAFDSGNVRAADAEERDLIFALGKVLDGAASGTQDDQSAPTAELERPAPTTPQGVPRLTQTGWWTVPLGESDLEAYLASHPLAEQSPGDWVSSTDGTGLRTTSYIGSWTGNLMIASSTLVVTLQDEGVTTAVRADAVAVPRHGRAWEGTVTKNVTGAVKRVGVLIKDDGVIWRRTLTDAGEIAEVVDAFNALPGATMGTAPLCGAVPALPELHLTIRGAKGTLVSDDHTLACGDEQVVVSDNGVPIRPLLDGNAWGSSFREDVEHLVGFGNEQASSAESLTLLDAVGSTLQQASAATVRDESAPTPDLAAAASTSSMGEPSLTRKGWWMLPLSSDDVVAYLKAHSIAGLDSGVFGSMTWGKIHGPQTTVATATYAGTSTDAYPQPQVNLEIETTPTGSAVRADTYISPRAEPSPASRVSDPVTSIDVVNRTTTYGAKVTTTRKRFTVTDAGTISQLVTALNAAPGAALYPGWRSCPAGRSDTTLALTLHTSSGAVVVHVEDGACGWSGASVSRGGVQQGPMLDGETLGSALTAVEAAA